MMIGDWEMEMEMEMGMEMGMEMKMAMEMEMAKAMEIWRWLISRASEGVQGNLRASSQQPARRAMIDEDVLVIGVTLWMD